MKITRGRVIVIIVGIVIVIGLASPRGTQPASTQVPATNTPASSIGIVGERIEAGGIALTVNTVGRMSEVNQFTRAGEGFVFVVLDVTVENVSRNEAAYNPFYFSLKDADGFEYSTSFSAPEPTFKSGDIVQGDKVRGNVAFEVKANSSGLVLTYDPQIPFAGYETIRVQLSE